MKLLFDFFPILLFFIAFKLFGIYVATAVAIAASVLQVAYVYLKNKRIENMHLVTLALIVILGGATLIFHDETFIKWKPSIVNWGFALAFLGSHFIGKKPIVRRLMDQALYLPDKVWNRLSYMWVVFFILSGIANIYVAYHYDTDTWVNFKLFGLMGLTLAFILVQGLYISRYIQDDKVTNEVNEKAMEALADVEMDSVVVAPHSSENKDDQKTTSTDTK
ncbi:septation protein A [Hydrogenovibrio kuenenii]|uniref:septation protein A n=1 Tax=Hydrogenovibrio kuenenii TaxID=63658 RepID=UPI000467378D|nr:septation protein A [Hydrogenovibrio kuenenii]